jgi:putative FmdB family regulatory protein
MDSITLYIKVLKFGLGRMPRYDFKCNLCTTIIETTENIPPVCDTCDNTMTRVWSAVAVKFNGSGFYSTGG